MITDTNLTLIPFLIYEICFSRPTDGFSDTFPSYEVSILE